MPMTRMFFFLGGARCSSCRLQLPVVQLPHVPMHKWSNCGTTLLVKSRGTVRNFHFICNFSMSLKCFMIKYDLYSPFWKGSSEISHTSRHSEILLKRCGHLRRHIPLFLTVLKHHSFTKSTVLLKLYVSM